MRAGNRLVSLVVGLVLASRPVLAGGQLDAFSQAAQAVSGSTGGSDSGGDAVESCLFDLAAEVLAPFIVVGIGAGGAMSLGRVSGDGGKDWLDIEVSRRGVGEPLIPYLRIDADYRDIGGDIKAWDATAELGFGPLAGRVSASRYEESIPESDALTTVQAHLLYRMSFDRYVEVDVGLGALTVEGETSDSRFCFTLPVLVYPVDYVGLEFRPAWTDTVDDYDVALCVGPPVFYLKAGYRWIKSGLEELNGPYAGVSIRF